MGLLIPGWLEDMKKGKPAKGFFAPGWAKDMTKGKPRVVANFSGGFMLDHVLQAGEKLGYEVINISQSQSAVMPVTSYTVIFKKKVRGENE